MFFTVGISYLLMSSPLLLKKRLSLNLNYMQLFIYRSLFIVGFISVIIGILNLLFSHLFLVWATLQVLMICFVGISVIKRTQDYMKSLEVMKNLE